MNARTRALAQMRAIGEQVYNELARIDAGGSHFRRRVCDKLGVDGSELDGILAHNDELAAAVAMGDAAERAEWEILDAKRRAAEQLTREKRR